jgi:hypothetical protein
LFEVKVSTKQKILWILPPGGSRTNAITAILSSIGSGIQLIDQTTTQIPYALVCAGASLLGFIVLGFTRSTTVGLLTTLAALAAAVFVLRTRFAGETSGESEVGGPPDSADLGDRHVRHDGRNHSDTCSGSSSRPFVWVEEGWRSARQG